MALHSCELSIYVIRLWAHLVISGTSRPPWLGHFGDVWPFWQRFGHFGAILATLGNVWAISPAIEFHHASFVDEPEAMGQKIPFFLQLPSGPESGCATPRGQDGLDRVRLST